MIHAQHVRFAGRSRSIADGASPGVGGQRRSTAARRAAWPRRAGQNRRSAPARPHGPATDLPQPPRTDDRDSHKSPFNLGVGGNWSDTVFHSKSPDFQFNINPRQLGALGHRREHAYAPRKCSPNRRCSARRGCRDPQQYAPNSRAADTPIRADAADPRRICCFSRQPGPNGQNRRGFRGGECSAAPAPASANCSCPMPAPAPIPAPSPAATLPGDCTHGRTIGLGLPRLAEPHLTAQLSGFVT